MGLERELRGLDKFPETGITIISLFVKTLGEQVLTIVVLSFFLVREISVAGVEALGQKQKAANVITVFIKVIRVLELVLVPVMVVRPDVLHLIGVLAAPLDILLIARSAS
jgi:hypothetical protein